MRSTTLAACLISSALGTEDAPLDPRPAINVNDWQPHRAPTDEPEERSLLDYFPGYHHFVNTVQSDPESLGRCNVKPAMRTRCGDRFTEQEDCNKMGCCWDGHSTGHDSRPDKNCFFPEFDHTAHQEMALATEDSTCLIQTKRQRKQCLGHDVKLRTQSQCESKGCCWDATLGKHGAQCFVRDPSSICPPLKQTIDQHATQFRHFYHLRNSTCTKGREQGSICKHTCENGIGYLTDICVWDAEAGRPNWFLDSRESCRYVQGCAARDLLILDRNARKVCKHAMEDPVYGTHRMIRCQVGCRQGYHLKAGIPEVSFCGSGMKWTTNYDNDGESICEPDNAYACEVPMVENGKFYCTPGDAAGGKSCFLRCKEGFRMIGSKQPGFGYRIDCNQATQKWDNMNPLPQCVATFCDKFDTAMLPSNSNYGTCDSQMHTTGTVCSVSCKNGQTNFGDSEFTCRYDNAGHNEDKTLMQNKWPLNTGRWDGASGEGMAAYCLDDTKPRCGISGMPADEMTYPDFYVNSRRKRDLSGEEVADRVKRLAEGWDPIDGRTIEWFPWTVALIDRTNPALMDSDRHDDSIDSRYICSGVFISNEWVLTAAHCLRHMKRDLKSLREDLIIYSGIDMTKQLIRDFQSQGWDGDAKGYYAEQIFVHPYYRNGQPYFDLAMVKVSSADGNNMDNNPACLSGEYNDIIKGINEEQFTHDELHMCHVSAFGQHGQHPDVDSDNTIDAASEGLLTSAPYQLINESECELLKYHTEELDSWPAWAALPWWKKAELNHVVRAKDAGVMCAFAAGQILQLGPDEAPDYDPWTGACQGDSGAPLVCYNRIQQKWILKGILAWGQTCMQPTPKMGDIFVDMENKEVLQWTLDVMNYY